MLELNRALGDFGKDLNIYTIALTVPEKALLVSARRSYLEIEMADRWCHSLCGH